MDRDVPLLQPTGPGSEPTVYYKGCHLYSTRRPTVAPDRLAANTPLLPDSLILVPSLGLGYGIPALLKRLPPGCHVLCVEHDPALWHLADATRRRLAGAAGLTLLQAADLRPVKAFLDARTPGGFRRVTTLPLCAAARFSPEFYRAVESFLAGEIQTHWQNRMTLFYMGRLFVKNLFANLTLLPRGRDLGALTTNRPVLAVGAGPSLTPTLPLLRRFRHRVVLLAVDTALPILLDSGLTPDYVLALEPQFINIGDFIGLPPGAVSVIADLSSAPQAARFCLQARHCPLYLFSSEFHPLALWDRLAQAGLRPLSVPPLGSVGVTAVYAALRITRHPVLLAGFDFSYPYRRTHAAGGPAALTDQASARRCRPVGQTEFTSLAGRPRVTLPGKGDRRVESDLVLSSYAANLKGLIAREKRVFDLSPAGLDLGAPLLETEADVRKVIGHCPASPAPAAPASIPSGWKAEHILSFLIEEERLLKAADGVLAGLVEPAGPERGTLNQKLWETLARTEHAYFYLAGKTSFPEYSQASAAQALIETRILAERIRRASSSLGRTDER